MELKPGHKPTEVGAIPNDWDVASFKERFNISAGGDVNLNLSVAEQDEIHPYPIYSNALTNGGLYGYCSYADHPVGSITITARGTLGVAAYRDHKYTAIGRVLVLEPRQETSGKFFAKFINSRVRFAIESTGVPQLTAPQIGRYLLAVPPYPEQRAIAAALNDVDALLDGVDRLIAKKRDLKQAAMQQLLTGQIRLPGFHGEWETKRVGEIGMTYGGLTGKTKADFGVGHARYITFLNVLENVVIDPHQCELVRVGPGERQNPVRREDILFNGTSETPGDLAMAAVTREDEDNLFLNSFCFGFRVHDASEHLPLFLAYYFRGSPGRHIMRALAQGATRYNMSKSQFKALALSLPQHDEQKAIATVLCDMDAEIAALEARRDKTRNLKQAMMQELLTGKTRLVQPEVAHA